MLIVKVFINEKKIDELHIWNKAERFDLETDCYEYRLLSPEGYKDIPILHIRSEGYKPLLRKALKVIDDVDKNKEYIKWLRNK